MATQAELDAFIARQMADDRIEKKDLVELPNRAAHPDFQLATLVRGAVAEAHPTFSAAQIVERADKILATGAYQLTHDSRIRPADDLRNIEKALRVDPLVVSQVADKYASSFRNATDATRARLAARGIAVLGLFDGDESDDDEPLGAA